MFHTFELQHLTFLLIFVQKTTLKVDCFTLSSIRYRGTAETHFFMNASANLLTLAWPKLTFSRMPQLICLSWLGRNSLFHECLS